MRHPLIVSTLALAALMIGGCTASAEPRGAAAESEIIAADLAAPWSVAFLADGTALMSERDTARILELLPDGTTRVVGTVEGVTPGGEGGLLGLAVDAEDRLYAYSTAASGNRIQRFRLSGSPLRLGTPETMLDGLPSARTHNGGRIAFGPDGMLYATVGDAGERAAAQDPASLAGKILRMTPDGAVPADNPLPGSLVYSLGHRNPQGIAWDAEGTLYAAEFGQDTWDELNVIEPGQNYGWPIVEGIADDDRFVDPVQQWKPADASPSGIAVVGDDLLIANLRGERLRSVPLDDLSASTDRFVGEYGRIRDVVRAPDGSALFVTSNRDGRGDVREGDDVLVGVD